MKLGRLIWTGVAALVLTTPALAEQSVEDRLPAMEKRIQYLEQRVAEQDNVIVEKDRQIAEATGQTAWTQGLEISGAMEIEARLRQARRGRKHQQRGRGHRRARDRGRGERLDPRRAGAGL